VGPSGSGKSTVVSLLQRFYDPAAGALLLDGRDLRAYDLAWLRQQVGVFGGLEDCWCMCSLPVALVVPQFVWSRTVVWL
jgi:ABC-type enterochelin transport system ATPase subunit